MTAKCKHTEGKGDLEGEYWASYAIQSEHTFPESNMKRTPSMVTDVSAMFVEIIHLRTLSGAMSNTCDRATRERDPITRSKASTQHELEFCARILPPVLASIDMKSMQLDTSDD